MAYTDKQKQREYLRRWMKSRRDSFFKDKRCIKCNSVERLELDHIDPKLKVSHRIWSWSKERQNVEIAKCQVLCYDCHKTKSSFDKSKPITHGNSGYRRGCRCEFCRAAHSERMKRRVR